MDWIQVMGMVAAVCTTASQLPQAIKAYRTKRTQDISLSMYLLLTLGILLWLIYGLMIFNMPLILANGISLLLTFFVLLLKLKHG